MNSFFQKKQDASDFSDALQAATAFVLDTFNQQIEAQRLYYHGLEHVEGVARRARFIFDTVVPFYQNAGYLPDVPWDRQRDLLQLSAIAHDMLQIFLPQSSFHSPRQRQSGHSEKATVDRLLTFIDQINTGKIKTDQIHQSPLSAADSTATEVAEHTIFTTADVALLRESIEATICQYDPADGSIYQPLLYARYRKHQPLSLVARALALADLGTLGIEGIEAYRQEGKKLLLEENLDLLSFCQNKSAFDEAFQENMRTRLLKRARFEVSFAKGRLTRLDAELEGLPVGAIAALKQQVFVHLTPATIQSIVDITPISDNTPLSQLLNYFHLNL